MSKNQSDLMMKFILGACLSVTVFLITDFILVRRAQAECNVRQDSEIQALRRDVSRQETTLNELRALSVEILKEVKSK